MDVPGLLSLFTSYGYETDDEMTDQFKLDALNETYWDACSRRPWPFLTTWASALSDVNGKVTSAGAHPQVGNVIAFTDGNTPRSLQPIRLDDLLQGPLNQSNPWVQDNPFYYYFNGEDLYVYPVPPDYATRGMNLVYSYIPEPLTLGSAETDIQFPKRYHRSVLGIGTLARLAVAQDDVEMSNAYERLYEKALTLMVDDVLTQQTDHTDYIHVYDSDNWDYS